MENPQLHLVWSYDQIYIKSIPKYLLSYAFWQYLATLPDPLQQSTIGFLRTYSHLIRYESDFRIAIGKDCGLIPNDNGEEPITWERFAAFIEWFDKMDDAHVNPQYHYGELRLTRLNICARVFLGKLTFHHIHAQWRSFLGQMFTPLLSLFAILSVILNAMQVELAVEAGGERWKEFTGFCHYMCMLVLILTACTISLFMGMIFFMFFHDIWFARSVMREIKKGRLTNAEVMKSGVV